MIFGDADNSDIRHVPSLLAVILTMTMFMFVSAAIIREKELDNTAFLIVTPMSLLDIFRTATRWFRFVIIGIFLVYLCLFTIEFVH
jgi:ABC-2 type transport system permease protein